MSFAALLSNGVGALLRHRRAAWPLALLYGLVSLILLKLFWPTLAPAGEAQEDRMNAALVSLALTVVLFGVATGLGVLWARVVLVGPEQAFAGGWAAFLARWQRTLYRLLTALLAELLLILPAMMAGAMAGLVLSIFLGGAATVVQTALMVAFFTLPSLLVLAALWMCVIREAVDRPLSLFAALQNAFRAWRQVIALMAVMVAGLVVLYLLLPALFGEGGAMNPGTFGGMVGQLLLGTGEMGLQLFIIAALASALVPPKADGSGEA